MVHVASGREWRGGQRQVWLLARELHRQAGVSQVVVTGAGSELARRVRLEGVPVREVGWKLGLDPRVCAAVLAELRGGPALLHAHDAHAVTLAGICGSLAGRPLVATRRVTFHLRRKGFWGRACRVIAVSRAVAATMESDGIDPARLVVIHSGVALDAVRTAAPLGIRATLRIPADALVAVNVGALGPDKDHETLLRAAKLLERRCPKLHWVVAGEGRLRPALERLLGEASLHGRVHLVGHLDDPLRLIADADLFVMSSRHEGLGTSVVDAMARGIPVASTSAGGLPELLADGAGLLVPPGDPPALADAVARIVDQPALRQALAERGRLAAERFSAERMAAAVRSVYRSCVPFP